jgi:hypothetical protein
VGRGPSPMAESQVRLLIRIPGSLKAKLVDLAQKEHRSLNRQIEFLLDLSVRHLTQTASEGLSAKTMARKKSRS